MAPKKAKASAAPPAASGAQQLAGAGPKSTRLDKLLQLVADGTSPAVKVEAARQLAGLTFTPSLLGRLHPLLHHKEFSTRVAAASAIGLMAKKDEWQQTEPAAAVPMDTDTGGNEAAVPPDPTHAEAEDEAAALAAAEDEEKALEATLLRLGPEPFDLGRVLRNGQLLLSSEGREFEFGGRMTADQLRAHMAEQRKNLMHRLGLEGDASVLPADVLAAAKRAAAGAGKKKGAPKVSTSTAEVVGDLVTDADLITPSPAAPSHASNAGGVKRMAPDLLVGGSDSSEATKTMSIRERARQRILERKEAQAVANSSGSTVKSTEEWEAATGGSSKKRRRTVVTDGGEVDGQQQSVVVEAFQEEEEGVLGHRRWPFTLLVALCREDLFSPVWETRHGSALALREVLTYQGGRVGMVRGISPEEATRRNQLWLGDLAIRFLCVMGLDRFGDFVSDEAMAPVRETCSQGLGMALSHLQDDGDRNRVLDLLWALQQEGSSPTAPIWELRHAAFLGVKYFFAVALAHRRRAADPAFWEDKPLEPAEIALLEKTFPLLLRGLCDPDDDVRAVVAAATLPIAPLLAHFSSLDVTDASHPSLLQMIDLLWHSLNDLDDLTSSTRGVLELLAAVYSHRATRAIALAPRDAIITEDGQVIDVMGSRCAPLFPFFRHSSVAVRGAALRTLGALLGDAPAGAPPSAAAATAAAPAAAAAAAEPEQAWLVRELAQSVCRHVFQALLAENDPGLLHYLSLSLWRRVWQAVPVAYRFPLWQAVGSAYLAPLLGSPARHLLVSRYVVVAEHARSNLTQRRRPVPGGVPVTPAQKEEDAKAALAEKESSAAETARQARLGVTHEDEEGAHAMRLVGGAALAWLLAWKDGWGFGVSSSPVEDCLDGLLRNSSALVRQGAAFLLQSARAQGWVMSVRLATRLQASLDEVVVAPAAKKGGAAAAAAAASEPPPVAFDEMKKGRTRLLKEASALVLTLQQSGLSHGFLAPISAQMQAAERGTADPKVIVPTVQALVAAVPGWFGQLVCGAGQVRRVQNSHGALAVLLQGLEGQRLSLFTQTASALAGAVAMCGHLPAKLNNVVRPLMAALGKEQCYPLQRRAASCLAHLLNACRTREKSPADLILKNSLKMLCGPGVAPSAWTKTPTTGGLGDGDGGLAWRGAAFLLQALMELLPGCQFCEAFPPLHQPLLTVAGGGGGGAEGRDASPQAELLSAVRYVGSLAGLVPLTEGTAAPVDVYSLLQRHPTQSAETLVQLQQQLVGLITPLFALLQAADSQSARATELEQSARAALVALVDRHMTVVMAPLLEQLTSLVGDAQLAEGRLAAVSLMWELLDTLDQRLLPYAVFLVAPLMARMSDQHDPTRLMASRCFAVLVRMLPLEEAIPDPEGLPAELLARKADERAFLKQLLDPSCIDRFQLPITLPVALRSYQQDGLNWLNFLRRFGLHGVLADDMGLGKTLQTLCIIVSAHLERRQKGLPALPSLVVCPPSVVGHWVQECQQYLGDSLQVVAHAPKLRAQLQRRLRTDRDVLVVTSYDGLRGDSEHLSKVQFSYAVLDEGHIIRRHTSKTSIAARALRANHRLILSGTPIQNNVLELWTLFEFLMPGFLGSHASFQANVAKPIQQTRQGATAAQTEAAQRAMDSLHRQVLPFVMRREKERVLDDLPPKIIQDRRCDLSPLQRKLYESFSSVARRQLVQEGGAVGEASSGVRKPNWFQVVQYLRQLCVHPRLVLGNSHPQIQRVVEEVRQHQKDLHDLSFSPKLALLREVLEECGLGDPTSATVDGGGGDITGDEGRRRVLIFCQQKAVLDLVEQDVLQRAMPWLSHLRLDGTVPAAQRQDVVRRFNGDPTIDILLLTTHVGGLGLNLTGADTVVFVEHDWNPMKDLQAMDRAHRLGQKKVVNVYRLITNGTVEEKINSLQKFKLHVSNTVLSEENFSLKSMGTDKLLDLMTFSSASTTAVAAGTGEEEGAGGGEGAEGSGVGMPGVPGIEADVDLWPEDEYNALSVESFLSVLAGSGGN